MGEFLWIIVGVVFVIFMLCKEGYWEVIGCILGFVLTIAVLYWLVQANAMLPAAIVFVIVIAFVIIYIKVRDNKGWIAIRFDDDGMKLRKILSEQTEIPNFKFDDIFIDKIYTDKSSPLWISAEGVPENVSVQECYDWLCVRITEFLSFVGIDIISKNDKGISVHLELARSKFMYADSSKYEYKNRNYKDELRVALVIERYYFMKFLGLIYKRYDGNQNKTDYSTCVNANDLFAVNAKYLAIRAYGNRDKCLRKLKWLFQEKYDVFLRTENLSKPK